MDAIKVIALSFAAVVVAGILPPAHHAADPTADSSCCALVRQALADAERIKAGMRRGEVEKYFRYDGGLQFPGTAYYTHPKCSYLKLEVEFDAAPARGKSFSSPDDTVRTVSKLFVSYPATD